MVASFFSNDKCAFSFPYQSSKALAGSYKGAEHVNFCLHVEICRNAAQKFATAKGKDVGLFVIEECNNVHLAELSVR